ncbi:YdcF family protein [Nocardia sp. NBC_00416]|uniref:YdcF family protein n=1 Tax=Nocardia sp. NBC_00416 TaxID=2975991 RepID=UPI002E1AD8CB
MDPVVLFAAGWAAAMFGAYRMGREPRRLSSGFFVLAAVALTIAGAGAAIARLAEPSALVSAAVLLGALFLVAVIAAGLGLLTNGITVIRREGMRPTTVTPVLVGFGLLVLPVAATLALRRGPAVPHWLMLVAATATLVGLYLVAHLLAFAGHATVYGKLPDETGADAIVVLGCGLHRNRVTPLLAARLNRALQVYRAETAIGLMPLVITSGGKGSDEAVSEADAMAAYLVRAGVADTSIVRERFSRNTDENLRNSLDALRRRHPDSTGPRITVVTSNFHVLRAAAATRRIGVDAHVVGARTALYFLPAAFLREFAAVLTTHYRRTHVAVAAATVVALTAAAADAYFAV